MKEFEKWYSETQKGWYVQVHNPMKIAWKAALEWVLSIDEGFCNCGVMNVIDEHTSTEDNIIKELEN